MRPLPNGIWPYYNTLDCMSKITKYEANTKNHGNFQSFYAGGFMYWTRILAITYVSQYLIDFYLKAGLREPQWDTASYNNVPEITFDIREPYTMAFHNYAIDNFVKDGDDFTEPMTKDGKPLHTV